MGLEFVMSNDKLSREWVKQIADRRVCHPTEIDLMTTTLLLAWDALEPFARIKVPDDGRAMVTLECRDIAAARKALPGESE
jgi:hypothetical protein